MHYISQERTTITINIHYIGHRPTQYSSSKYSYYLPVAVFPKLSLFSHCRIDYFCISLYSLYEILKCSKRHFSHCHYWLIVIYLVRHFVLSAKSCSYFLYHLRHGNINNSLVITDKTLTLRRASELGNFSHLYNPKSIPYSVWGGRPIYEFCLHNIHGMFVGYFIISMYTFSSAVSLLYRVPPPPNEIVDRVDFSGLALINSYLFSPCWIEHLFLIIITPRSSNLVENFLFYE